MIKCKTRDIQLGLSSNLVDLNKKVFLTIAIKTQDAIINNRSQQGKRLDVYLKFISNFLWFAVVETQIAEFINSTSTRLGKVGINVESMLKYYLLLPGTLIDLSDVSIISC